MKTFLDSGVLIAAWLDTSRTGLACRLLDDSSRKFYTSQMCWLEVMPKAVYAGRQNEVHFYENHFQDCQGCEPLSEALGRDAEQLASRYGLAGADALQIAAALRQGVEEFYTSERPSKPLFRVKELKVLSLAF